MKKLSVLIVDDEPDAQTVLSTLIKEYCEGVEIAGIASGISQARKLIEQKKPQLIFLDIEMSEESGFDLLSSGESAGYKIVFTTAHTQYAIKAIKHDAIDYLLKPIDIDELIAAVNKVKITLEKENPKEKIQRIRLTGQKETYLVAPENILYIEADGRYSVVHLLSGEKHLITKNIGEFETELSALSFLRAHKSSLVNLQHIVRIRKGDEPLLEMKDGKLLEVSRRKKAEIAKLLGFD